jgi:hypothetical protein
MRDAQDMPQKGGIGAAVAIALNAESAARKARGEAEAQAQQRLETARALAQAMHRRSDARIRRAQRAAAAITAQQLENISRNERTSLSALMGAAFGPEQLQRAVLTLAAEMSGEQTGRAEEPAA